MAATPFTIFAATDVPHLAEERNTWGVNLEHLLSELRGAVFMQGADTESIRNAVMLLDQRTEALDSVGSRAVTELDAIMVAFHAEIVVSKS